MKSKGCFQFLHVHRFPVNTACEHLLSDDSFQNNIHAGIFCHIPLLNVIDTLW